MKLFCNQKEYLNSDSVSIDNKYVRVLHNRSECFEANTLNYGTRIIVALNDLELQSSKGIIKLSRGGSAVLKKDESYKKPQGEFFEVAIKTDHPPLLKPEQWIEPLKNTIVYEDEEIRIFEERLAPGDIRELHSHAQRVVVRLNDVQLTDPRFYKDNEAKGGFQVPNTAKYAEPVVHAVKNLSKIPLFNIVIEFKLNF